MSSSIFTKRKLLGFLMVLCLLSAVCATSVSAAQLTIKEDGKVFQPTNESGVFTMKSVGLDISYEKDGWFGLGMHITISPSTDKAKK